jgi:glucokinase
MSWVGLDVGGTRLKGGLLDDKGRIIARDFEPTQPGQSLRALERQLDRLVARLIPQHRSALQGIGAAITGPVNPEVGCVYLPGKIRGLDRHRTVPYLRRRWRVPVCADNDGRLACYAEWRAGAGRGVDNLLVFTLGTGIGSGVVLDGRLLTDRHFLRGTQCGHMVIDVDGPRCLTGARGTGESLASITALIQEARAHVARGLPTTLAGGAAHEIGFPEIVAAVRRNDRIVTEVFERWIDCFSATILNSFYAYTPDLILLAGGPTRAASIFLKKLEARLNATAFRVPVGYRIKIRIAKLGEDASWFGAALLARDRFGGGNITEDFRPKKHD